MPEVTNPLSLPDGRRIDALCDQFEADWRQGRRPSIDDYLPRIDGLLQPALRAELLRVEVEWRLLCGEQPALGDYASSGPALAVSLADILGAAREAFAARSEAARAESSPPTTTGAAGDLQETPPARDTAPATDEKTHTHPPPEVTAAGPSAPAGVRRVGEYDLVELLGEGGMGQVWKARHRRLGKLVALKLIRPGHQHSQAAVQRFLREMKAIGELEHPHVVEASDAGESDGSVYLAMKLIAGEDLSKYVRRVGPLTIGEARGLARQVALGLQYLHERGLVHRDLKPGNLIRTPEGVVKILDLGLARWQTDEGDLTRTGQSLGTPDYMAPEQVAEAADVDIRADLYALGATLFFLLAGRPPFGHIAGAFAKMKAHESTPPPDIRTLRPDVPGELADLVARLLAKRPEDRPATPAEVAGTLAPFTPDEPAAPDRTQPAARRRTWPWVGVAATLLVGAAVVLVIASRGRTDGDGRADLRLGSPAVEPGPKAKPVAVLTFDVSHAERAGESATEMGLLGVKSFSTRLGDHARVKVTLSRPAHGYLVAYAADGKEYLLDPPEETQAPKSSERLEYPPAGRRVEYELNDGVGLHVFLAVASSGPLPSYADWRREHGRAPWVKSAAREGAVWRQVGGDLHVATQTDPVRGPNAAVLGAAPVEKLAGWWSRRGGVEAVGLTGFSVRRAE